MEQYSVPPIIAHWDENDCEKMIMCITENANSLYEFLESCIEWFSTDEESKGKLHRAIRNDIFSNGKEFDPRIIEEYVGRFTKTKPKYLTNMNTVIEQWMNQMSSTVGRFTDSRELGRTLYESIYHYFYRPCFNDISDSIADLPTID